MLRVPFSDNDQRLSQSANVAWPPVHVKEQKYKGLGQGVGQDANRKPLPVCGEVIARHLLRAEADRQLLDEVLNSFRYISDGWGMIGGLCISILPNLMELLLPGPTSSPPWSGRDYLQGRGQATPLIKASWTTKIRACSDRFLSEMKNDT